MHPFNQVKIDGVIHRTFTESVDSNELIWHRDRKDRIVTVVESKGWELQYDGSLPISLSEGAIYHIPAGSWHRVIKGVGQLRVIINEETGMQITESQLRRIIRDEILREAAYEKLAERAYSDEADMQDEAETRKYGGKDYKASSGSVAAIKKHGNSAKKAVKAGAFDWADNPMAAAQAAHIVALGEPTVAKGTKRKKG